MVRRTLLAPLLAWVLWMDQTVYTVPERPDAATPPVLETGQSRWTQLAVTATRQECEALRKGHVDQAVAADAAAEASRGRGPRYRDRFRFFCSPSVDDTGK